jgi:hypothetical protein
MNFAFERGVLLFTSAEKIPVLASSLCKSYLSKPLPAFVKVVEEYVIFNFAIICKVHFSLEIRKKSILNTASANCFYPATPERTLTRRRARATSDRRRTAVRSSGVHAEVPENPSVHASRREATVRDIHERLDGAMWMNSTRRCATRSSPLGRWSAARRRALLPTPRVPVTWLTLGPPNQPSATTNTRPWPLLRPHIPPPPELRRPPLAPPGANLPPVDALTPTSPWALPCAPLKLPESLVDQAEQHDRRRNTPSGCRRLSPPHPLTGDDQSSTTATVSHYLAPRSFPVHLPAKPAAGLAAIRSVAPSPSAKCHIATSWFFVGCFP